MSHNSAFARGGSRWTLDHEVAAIGTETLAHLWADDIPDRLISHPERPEAPDRRRKSSNPDEIRRFLATGR